jgi:hypothetical protein
VRPQAPLTGNRLKNKTSDETEFKTETGSLSVIDFMPFGCGAELVRTVVGRSGRVEFRTEIIVRFNYGATVPWVSRLELVLEIESERAGVGTSDGECPINRK